MTPSLHPPWLIADLGVPHRVLSWSLTHPGFSTAHRIAFRQVQDADLTVDLDVAAPVASPDTAVAFSGLHTACGEAVGRAVYDAVAAGVRAWMGQQRG